ncbi:unnamed protein product, partial [Mesorhabditis belari]|uniref:tRNA/rRNA methyltransferase SpoU type domain-containing protein n=1 Tax=Mesorhabditis belari TaxID=2138241 RepID=A0AAF3J8Z0_9BILA
MEATFDDDLYGETRLYETLDSNSLEFALPSLCFLVEKLTSKKQNEKILRLIREYLDQETSTKCGRKAAMAALKLLVTGKMWTEMITLLEALEEPQFHIVRPNLALFHSIVQRVDEASIPLNSPWIWLLIRRASFHTNGWIREWAFESGLDYLGMFPEISQKYLITLIELLNSTDMLWRLVERESFEKQCQKLGEIVERIIQINDHRKAVNFTIDLLVSMTRLSCPFTFFYLSEALKNIDCQLLGEEHIGVVKEIIAKVHYISYVALKRKAIGNFVDFFARVIDWAKMPLHCFVFFSSIVSLDPGNSDECGAMKMLKKTIATREIHFLVQEECRMFQEIPWNYETDDPGWLFWTFACSEGNQVAIQFEVELERNIVELIDEGLSFKGTEALLHVWLRKPERVKTENRNPEESSSFARILTDYLTMRLFMLRGTNEDRSLVSLVLLPLVFKLPALIDLLPKAITEILKQSIPTEKLSLIYLILQQCLEKSSNSSEWVFEELRKYFNDKPFSMALSQKTISDLSKTDFQRICESLHTSRTKIFRAFYLKDVTDHSALVNEALEAIECASSFERKLELLKVVEECLKKITDETLLSQCIAAASMVCNEEQKSLNSLPSIRQMMRIALHWEMLKREKTTEQAMKLFTAQLKAASLSQPVAMVLAESLQYAQGWLDEKWTEQIFAVATFGPIPTKAGHVLNASYNLIYPENEADSSERFERIHEVVQRCRMTAISVAIQCCLRDEKFTDALHLEIIKQCLEMDKSTSRSFGLSYAHRGKTRALQLLLLSIVYLKDQKILSQIIDCCIRFVIDPCQQFSIKLLVEWIMVTCANRDGEVFEQIVKAQEHFATTRIGSVTSWLNILTLFARIKREDLGILERILALIAPWTSAQNFSVRCTAIAASKLLYGYLPDESKNSWKVLKSIIDFDAEPAGNSRRVIDNLCSDFYFSHLHSVEHFDLQTILRKIVENTGMPDEEWITERIILELNETEYRSLNPDREFLQAKSLVHNSLSKCNTCAPEMEIEEKDSKEIDEANEELNLQRKLVTIEWKKPEDCSLIVIANLVDKAANLGGLCRTSEIFSVDTLVLADLAVVKDASFKALSMSSENWQKMEAVKVDDLYLYLDSLKQAGYTVIGAEQTTNSVQMHKFAFPRKCALIVGDEREGIPTKLLRYIDQTVEITQFGQTRSLNVHVTAALFISKYAEQHYCK